MNHSTLKLCPTKTLLKELCYQKLPYLSSAPSNLLSITMITNHQSTSLHLPWYIAKEWHTFASIGMYLTEISFLPFKEDQAFTKASVENPEYFSSMYERSMEGKRLDGRFIYRIQAPKPCQSYYDPNQMNSKLIEKQTKALHLSQWNRWKWQS